MAKLTTAMADLWVAVKPVDPGEVLHETRYQLGSGDAIVMWRWNLTAWIGHCIVAGFGTSNPSGSVTSTCLHQTYIDATNHVTYLATGEGTTTWVALGGGGGGGS